MPDPIEIIVEPPPPEVIVIVEAPIEVDVTVEPPLPEVIVESNPMGLPGRDGIDGIDGTNAEDPGGILDVHINSETPHPVYDDGPSLVLLYQNAKV